MSHLNMVVLHLTYDLPDIINPEQANAVINLYSSKDHLERMVFTLNKTMNLRSGFKPSKELYGYISNIFGLPSWILLYCWMDLALKKLDSVILHCEYIMAQNIDGWFLKPLC